MRIQRHYTTEAAGVSSGRLHRRGAGCCKRAFEPSAHMAYNAARRTHLLMPGAGMDPAPNAAPVPSPPIPDPPPPDSAPLRRGPRWAQGLTRNVFVLGMVSLFTDISSEMIVPVRILFL